MAFLYTGVDNGDTSEHQCTSIPLCTSRDIAQSDIGQPMGDQQWCLKVANMTQCHCNPVYMYQSTSVASVHQHLPCLTLVSFWAANRSNGP